MRFKPALRFRLRTVFVVLFLFSLFFGLLSMRWQHQAQERAHVNRLSAFNVQWDRASSANVIDFLLLGPEPIGVLRVPQDHAETFMDDQLNGLEALTALRDLRLENTSITDAAIESLLSLERLEYLDIRCTNISKAGYDRLKNGLPNATILWYTKSICDENSAI